MKASEIPLRLSEAAAILADLGEEFDTGDVKVSTKWREIAVHSINERDTLRAWCRLLSNPKADCAHGAHWIRGTHDAWGIVLYYKGGLLGTVRKEKIVETEESQDVAGLLAESVA